MYKVSLGPLKWIKHVGQTLLDVTCLTHLNSTFKHVGLCVMKFDFVQIFHPTFLFAWSKISHNFMSGTETQHCWIVLDSFEHSSIQHNQTPSCQHHLTMLDNV